jgi:hypothetical protein
MKLSKLILTCLAIIICFSFSSVETKGKRSKRSMSKTKYWIKPLLKTAKSYLSFANLAYCNVDVIRSLACPLCSSIMDNSFKVLDLHSCKGEGHSYRFVILASDSHKEIIVSFSGPKTSEGAFHAAIYTSGWGKLHGQRVEKAYLKAYKAHFQVALENSMIKMFTQNPKYQDYKFIFVGHSFGGSIAVLAAFDLLNLNVLNRSPQSESPLVYSYGQLRIGDDQFVESVNNLFKVIRIVKNTDFMSRLPNCVWSQQVGKWRCFRDTYNLMMRYPEYKRYIMNYSTNNGSKQAYTGLQAAYGNYRGSFLQKNQRHKGFHYTMNNPGRQVYSYGSTLENQGAKSFGNIYYSQPMGAEVIFSNRFKKFQVCSFFKGVPNCEGQLPKKFGPAGSANYYGHNVEEC